MAHTCNPSTLETEAGRATGTKGQPGLGGDLASKNERKIGFPSQHTTFSRRQNCLCLLAVVYLNVHKESQEGQKRHFKHFKSGSFPVLEMNLAQASQEPYHRASPCPEIRIKEGYPHCSFAFPRYERIKDTLMWTPLNAHEARGGRQKMTG